jgi:peptide/nickel transport system substrate-binding protein
MAASVGRDRGGLWKRWRPGRRTFGFGALACATAMAISACGSGTGAGTAASHTSGSAPVVKGTPVEGGVASYALPIGEDFSWMLPLENQANYESYDGNVELGMWRPLYYVGAPGKTGIDYAASIGQRPVYSNGDTTVTVDLNKGWKWSDGTPVTTADVKFFFELAASGAKSGKYANYVPGELPDDIASVTYPSAYQFVVHLKHAYNPEWFTGNQLTWVVPLPQQAWDKTCATCAVGNVAATPAGANKVYNFLYKASSSVSTYATNPLWKTVDGPWVIKSYNPTTYHTVMAANPHYTGPGKPKLAGYEIYAFNSDTAELDAVRSGTVDFGFIPVSDQGEISYFKSNGYNVDPWRNFYNEDIEFGYTGPWKALVSQLYIRQALQHLVDQPLYIKQAMHGYGLPDYGVAPDYPGSQYVAPALRTNPYPYSVSAATKLLTSHGWAKGANGIDVCQKPGTAANECGAGIPKGKPLSIMFMYSTGNPSFQAMVEAFATSAKQAGIDIPLDGQTENTMYSIAGVCPPGPCKYGLAGYAGYMWDFGQAQVLPVGGNQFGKGNYWAGGYNSATADALIAAAHDKPGLQPLYAAETYLTKNVASLFWPLGDYEIAAVKKNLAGWYPLSPYDNFQVSNWYMVK